MKVGQYQTLKVDRITRPGAFLTDGTQDVLLPGKYISKDLRKGDRLNVFVYRDSEDRLVCTTEKPYAQAHEFAFLKVKDVGDAGAFLDWGLEKDLLIPYREQKNKLKKGQWVLVYVQVDPKTDRLMATAKVSRYFEPAPTEMQGCEVDVLVTHETEMGLNVVVNNRYKGLIFKNDLFHDTLEGDRIKGFVKAVRADGKLDISLRKEGMENLEEGAQHILNELKQNGGHLPLHDKSDPEEIQAWLQMSKKNFKRSVGILYKRKLVQITTDGLKLV